MDMAEITPPVRLVRQQWKEYAGMPGKTAQQINAEAADWAARIDRGDLPPEQDALFQAWLAQDVRCLGAYGRMRALALTSERARALGPDFDPAAFTSAPVCGPARRRLLQ